MRMSHSWQTTVSSRQYNNTLDMLDSPGGTYGYEMVAMSNDPLSDIQYIHSSQVVLAFESQGV